MSGVKRKLEILQKLDNGESASTDAADALNEGNAISHSAALQSVETLLDYMGQRGFDYGDITAQKAINYFVGRNVLKAPQVNFAPRPAFVRAGSAPDRYVPLVIPPEFAPTAMGSSSEPSSACDFSCRLP
ncbi:hypothetical protein AVEN_234086-1 [Araneus ventricosus]|uniref:Uncharacterized protein n=1 Tax=Araneus ventricosus TaxID=182803 RepID=A0A4Y2USK3_ARAVE|nr:hypothetical protein AVEN_234086-1 [Araneus ventricosus]